MTSNSVTIPVIFVFGSNRQGIHGAGAASFARRECGAIMGQAEGLQGSSYAIITKELRPSFPPVTLDEVARGVATFLDFARANPSLSFFVTPIGCGLAGFKPHQIAPLFTNVPPNVSLPSEFLLPASTERPPYKVNLEYFKPNGKWKYSGSYTSHKEALSEIWDEVRALRDSGQLPGLHSGSWDGPIFVDAPFHPNSHPHLII